ncbi:MAG: hypothetical protein JWO94_738, partial [Verrucomicrobiaceae bacterium]|nr:hypothetical protein [Verrucomicrobiaceae bacterium]
LAPYILATVPNTGTPPVSVSISAWGTIVTSGGIAYNPSGWHKTAPTASLTGRHSFTIHLNSEVGDPQFPQGPGPGGLTITHDGSIAVAGRIGDGTAFPTATILRSQGEWLIYSALYNSRGYVLSPSAIDAAPPHITSGFVDWYRAPSASGPYKDGFDAPNTLLSGSD